MALKTQAKEQAAGAGQAIEGILGGLLGLPTGLLQGVAGALKDPVGALGDSITPEGKLSLTTLLNVGGKRDRIVEQRDLESQFNDLKMRQLQHDVEVEQPLQAMLAQTQLQTDVGNLPFARMAPAAEAIGRPAGKKAYEAGREQGMTQMDRVKQALMAEEEATRPLGLDPASIAATGGQLQEAARSYAATTGVPEDQVMAVLSQVSPAVAAKAVTGAVSDKAKSVRAEAAKARAMADKAGFDWSMQNLRQSGPGGTMEQIRLKGGIQAGLEASKARFKNKAERREYRRDLVKKWMDQDQQVRMQGLKSMDAMDLAELKAGLDERSAKADFRRTMRRDASQAEVDKEFATFKAGIEDEASARDAEERLKEIRTRQGYTQENIILQAEERRRSDAERAQFQGQRNVYDMAKRLLPPQTTYETTTERNPITGLEETKQVRTTRELTDADIAKAVTRAKETVNKIETDLGGRRPGKPESRSTIQDRAAMHKDVEAYVKNGFPEGDAIVAAIATREGPQVAFALPNKRDLPRPEDVIPAVVDRLVTLQRLAPRVAILGQISPEGMAKALMLEAGFTEQDFIALVPAIAAEAEKAGVQ